MGEEGHPQLSLGRFEKEVDWVEVLEFLEESNAIELENSQIGMGDAVKAWNYAINNYEKVASDIEGVDYILNIHAILMKRLNQPIAGKLRTTPVYIQKTDTGEIVRNIPFISTALIKDELKKWVEDHIFGFRFDNLKAEWHVIKKSHVEFELLHPFEDGNGRVGRILMNVMRLCNGLALLVIHAGPEQMEYYKWFQEGKE